MDSPKMFSLAVEKVDLGSILRREGNVAYSKVGK
jgi:hypothetical protein